MLKPLLEKMVKGNRITVRDSNYGKHGGISTLTAEFGFKTKPKIPSKALLHLLEKGITLTHTFESENSGRLTVTTDTEHKSVSKAADYLELLKKKEIKKKKPEHSS